MNKKVLYTLLGIGLFVILISGIYCATTWQDKKIRNLQKQITFLKSEIVPIRFKILDRSNDTIYVSLKFYDLDRNVVFYYDDEGQRQEFVRIRMPGKEIAFDFIVIPVGGRYVAFPYKIFTDAIAPKDGIILFPYYDRDNFPQIYYSENSTPSFNAGMKTLFMKIKRGDIQDLKGAFGSVVQDVAGVKQFEVGRVYRIVVHPAKGGIEIIQE